MVRLSGSCHNSQKGGRHSLAVACSLHDGLVEQLERLQQLKAACLALQNKKFQSPYSPRGYDRMFGTHQGKVFQVKDQPAPKWLSLMTMLLRVE